MSKSESAKNILDKVLTAGEAASLWGLDSSTLRHAIRKGKFEKHEYRKTGRDWLILKEAMIRLYGEPKKA